VYVINIQHRNGNLAKSQWTIPQLEEVGCFTHAKAQGWFSLKEGWGLHFVATRPHLLGVARNRAVALFIAKFVGSDETNWHGYPADYRHNHHDIPSGQVLKTWLDQSVLPKAKIRKITKGQPCSL